MSPQIRKATRKKAKLRLGISAPTGAGKTYSALLIASGIGPKVGLIDTENGSGDLYADTPEIKKALPNGYDIINIQAPYDPAKYLEAIKAFESAGYDCIIIDSLSHAWSGSGGLLDKQGKETDRVGNSWVAWRKVTPQHNALVDSMLFSPAHIIACMRAKTEYVQEKNEQGKTVVRKVGLAPVMRDGIEYEFTVFGELDQSHNFQASKDRTGTFGDTFQVPTKSMGERLLHWLNSGSNGDDQSVQQFVGQKSTTGFNLREWAKSFAKELKETEDEGQITYLMSYDRANVELLSLNEPSYYARIMQIIMDKKAEFNKPPKDINDDLRDGIKPLSGVTSDDELTEALAIPPALKRSK